MSQGNRSVNLDIRLSLGLLLVVWTISVSADPGLSRILLNGRDAYVLGEQMDVYEDKGRKLAIDDMIRKPLSDNIAAFRKGFPNWGFTDYTGIGACWSMGPISGRN